jgi:hypothetical protein
MFLLHFLISFFYIFTHSAHAVTDKELLDWYNKTNYTATPDMHALRERIKEHNRICILKLGSKSLDYETDWPFVESLLNMNPESWVIHYQNKDFFLPDQDESETPTFPSIKSIDASGIKIHSKNILWFKRFPNLEFLNIDAHERHTFSGAGLKALAKHLPKWKGLCAWDSPHYSIEGMKEMAEIGFETLNLRKNALNDQHLNIFLSHHPHPAKVKSLTLNLNDFSDAAIQKLIAFDQLSMLQIGSNDSLSKAETIILLLQNMPHLVYFNAGNNTLNKEEYTKLLAWIASHVTELPQNLSTLYLSKDLLEVGFTEEEVETFILDLLPKVTSHLTSLKVFEILTEKQALKRFKKTQKSAKETTLWLNFEARISALQRHMFRLSLDSDDE